MEIKKMFEIVGGLPTGLVETMEEHHHAAIGFAENKVCVELPLDVEGFDKDTLDAATVAITSLGTDHINVKCRTFCVTSGEQFHPSSVTVLKSDTDKLSEEVEMNEMRAILISVINCPGNEALSAIAREILSAPLSPSDEQRKYRDLLNGIQMDKKMVNLIMHNEVANISSTSIKSGTVRPSIILQEGSDGFRLLKPTTSRVAAKIKAKDLEKRFKITEGREFTEEEKKMILDIPDWYEVSNNVVSIAERIKASWARPAHLRKTNVLMEGPAGTGKTMDAKVLSSLLGLPYTKVTCFSDMDSSDVIGAILPVANEKRYKPTEDEIQFDPVGTFELLTGKYDESITEEDVRAELLKESASAPEYVYYPSEIVKAFEHGYLCEIQEPTCISDAAVLMILNSALETDGVINLPQRTVKRHPDTIFVVTTNRNYEGCRPLNQALRDRFTIAKNCELPSSGEMVERLKKSTGCKNTKFLEKTVKAISALNKELEDMGINASASLRGASAYVADVMDGFDSKTSFEEDILFKITTDADDLDSLRLFLDKMVDFETMRI